MGRPDKAVYLQAATVQTDGIGNKTKVYENPGRMIFAEEIYLGANEYYQAAVAGMRPEKRFEVYAREYRWEDRLVYNNETYKIIRSSPGKTAEKLWLVCERVIAGA